MKKIILWIVIIIGVIVVFTAYTSSNSSGSTPTAAASAILSSPNSPSPQTSLTIPTVTPSPTPLPLTPSPALKSTPKLTPATTITKAPSSSTSACDPNYSGACVPIDSDVDCAGGKGNGPSYVKGPVRVMGRDIYGLDSDGDGIGCERN